jgi:hypothetical protein
MLFVSRVGEWSGRRRANFNIQNVARGFTSRSEVHNLDYLVWQPPLQSTSSICVAVVYSPSPARQSTQNLSRNRVPASQW